MNYYLAEFRRRVRAIDLGSQPLLHSSDKQIMANTLRRYEVVKRSGEEEKIIAVGLTLKDATTLMKCLHSRLIRLPLNEDGSPLFELELYELTIAGRKRYKETASPRFDSQINWIG